MSYPKRIISIDKKDELLQKHKAKLLFERKADINGICLRLWTDNEEFKHTWEDNWYFMSESVKSHGRLIAISVGAKRPEIWYDPMSCTGFFFDCDYYGWIKSAALAIAGDILEDNHDYYSIHGGLIDFDGLGTSIIGPAGTGKTTLTYGLLRHEGVKLVADDWHFFKIIDRSVFAFASEKNTYIRADLAMTWPEYSDIFKVAKIDAKGRGIADVVRIIGKGNIKRTSEIRNVILLRREKRKEIQKKLSANEALSYLEKVNYGNPHLLQHNAWKVKIRRRAFLSLLEKTNNWLINTIETPEQSAARICKLIGITAKKRAIEIK